MRKILVSAFILCLMHGFHTSPNLWAQEEWWECWSVLQKLGFDYSASGFTRVGDHVYFIGRKKQVSGKSPDQDTFWLLRQNTQSVEECIGAESVAKFFPPRITPEAGCFAVNPQETMLIIGKTETSISPEAKKTITELYQIDLLRKEIRCVSDGQDNKRGYQFSPNGKYLLFHSYEPEAEPASAMNEELKSYAVSLLNMDSGEVIVLKPAPSAKTLFFYPLIPAVWSPDSQWVVFEYLQPSDPIDAQRELLACHVDDNQVKVLKQSRSSFTGLRFDDNDTIVFGTSGSESRVKIRP